MKSFIRAVAVIAMLAVAATLMPLMGGQVYAASGKPAAPKILSAKETTNYTDDFKAVVVKWGKAKGAKKYQVAIRSAEKKWVKEKSVKKSAKNKKKYTKKNKYRVVAKGKKYVVYKYAYKYTILDATKSCSYRFIQDVDWNDLRPDTTYTFAVRSVNGKKYSAWKTAAVKTSIGSWESTTINSPGASLTRNIDGKSITLTIGKECTVPAPQPKKGTVEATAFSIIPAKIESYIDRSSGPDHEDITVTGKTTDGYNVTFKITHFGGVSEQVYYHITHPTFNKDNKYSSEGLGYGPGYYGVRYTVLDPDVTIVWALDGTEPRPGQADKYLNGNEYPFAQVTSNSSPYNGSLKVRGSGTSESGSTSIWAEIKKALFNKCEWIRIYDGETLVEEYFTYEGYYG